MQAEPGKHYRELAMLIDEYHLLATAGGARPMGDEKFLNLCRAAKCIPVVAFQSLSSLKDTVPAETWRTIIAAFATTIVLRQKDLFTAEIVSKMCGRVDTFKEHYGFTEGGHDAKVSLVTGRTTAPRSSINMSHSYNLTREFLKEPKDIMELPRGVAIVLANNGDEQLPPTFCYLTPYGEDPRISYWARCGRLERLTEAV
jgi:type IV secretory pathway TraG/TraD family ATPase VirD4